MGILVGLLLGLGLFWVVVYLLLRLIKNLPLGTGNLWSKTDRANNKLAVASQQRLFDAWKRMWPMALAAVVAAVAIAAMSG